MKHPFRPIMSPQITMTYKPLVAAVRGAIAIQQKQARIAERVAKREKK